MPTVALINGHAFAGGLITAMMHDYRIMNPERGFLCMNELDFGAPLYGPLSSIFREKLSASTYRSILLEAKRFAGPQALKEGIVDGLGGLPEALAYVRELQLVGKAQSGVYGVLKAEMWRETVGHLDAGGEVDNEYIAGVRKTAEAQALRAAKSAKLYGSAKSKL